MANITRSVLNAVKDSDLKILGELRCNSRQTLAEISKNTKISISTVYDRIRFHEDQLIKKHTSLLNFDMLGYSIRAHILISASQRSELKNFIKDHPNINSAFEINNGFDFIIDCFFSNMSECRDFVNCFDRFSVERRQVHYIIDEIRLESFMESKRNIMSNSSDTKSNYENKKSKNMM